MTFNLLILRINAKGALYDNEVKEIRLFNYKILTDNISLDDREKVWWLADRLVDHGEYYILEIDLQDFDANPEEFTVKIKFEKAQRKGRLLYSSRNHQKLPGNRAKNGKRGASCQQPHKKAPRMECFL